LVAPVVLFWLDNVFAEDFFCVFISHDCLCLIDEDQHSFPGMVFSNSKVEHRSCSPESQFSVFIDVVVPDSPVIGDGIS
jgi:hypothetical protein